MSVAHRECRCDLEPEWVGVISPTESARQRHHHAPRRTPSVPWHVRRQSRPRRRGCVCGGGSGGAALSELCTPRAASSEKVAALALEVGGLTRPHTERVCWPSQHRAGGGGRRRRPGCGEPRSDQCHHAAATVCWPRRRARSRQTPACSRCISGWCEPSSPTRSCPACVAHRRNINAPRTWPADMCDPARRRSRSPIANRTAYAPPFADTPSAGRPIIVRCQPGARRPRPSLAQHTTFKSLAAGSHNSCGEMVPKAAPVVAESCAAAVSRAGPACLGRGGTEGMTQTGAP